MAYEDQEHSVAGGSPYFLYQFTNNSGSTRLTAAPGDITVGGHTWTVSAIAHSEVEQTGSVEKSELEFTFPLSDEYARDFLLPATQITTVTVFRAHYTDLSNEIQGYWKGRLVGSKSSKFNVILVAESVFTSLRRPGCRVRIQRSCRHDHYGAVGCTLSRAAHEVPGSVTAVSGSSLTIPAAAGYEVGHFNAGIINWNGRFGFVQAHSGSSIVLVSDIPDLDEATLPQAVLMAPGCDRSLEGNHGCVSFSNQLNYGGYRWIPSLNPFSGSLV